MNEDDVQEPKVKPGEGLVLVGFGKHDLKDMLLWQDTPQEEDLAIAFKKWPPVYRREKNCNQEDLKAACQYLAYLQDLILEWELNNPSEDKENNDE
jgi:hypothetical protein